MKNTSKLLQKEYKTLVEGLLQYKSPRTRATILEYAKNYMEAANEAVRYSPQLEVELALTFRQACEVLLQLAETAEMA